MNLNFAGRQFKSHGLVIEIDFVRSIAKWFVGRVATAAQRNYCASLQAVSVTLCVHDFKVAI